MPRSELLRVTPAPWRWLSDRFLDAPYEGERVARWFPGDTLLSPIDRPHGLPIGSLTSQIWANLYLSPLDHLLGARLGIGSFARYCPRLPHVLRHALSLLLELLRRVASRCVDRVARLLPLRLQRLCALLPRSLDRRFGVPPRPRQRRPPEVQRLPNPTPIAG